MVRIRLQPLALELVSTRDERLVDLVDEIVGERALQGLPLSCRGARCGACKAHVLSGASSLAAAGSDECDTLQRLGGDPDERLACQIWLRADASEDVELAFTALTAPPA
jgi:ferredoxin